jgi:hypothetical protein
MQDLAVWNIPDSELESRSTWTSQTVWRWQESNKVINTPKHCISTCAFNRNIALEHAQQKRQTSPLLKKKESLIDNPVRWGIYQAMEGHWHPVKQDNRLTKNIETDKSNWLHVGELGGKKPYTSPQLCQTKKKLLSLAALRCNAWVACFC